MRRTRSARVSELSFSRMRATISGKASGLGRAISRTVTRDVGEAGEGAAEAAPLELPLQHLAVGLVEQQVLRVVLGEHLVEQAARRLEVAGGLALPGEALEEQAGDAGDVAELPLRHLGRVEARRDVVGEAGGREEPRRQRLVERRRVGGEQLDPVVVHRQREGDRPQAGDPPGEERRQPLVDQPSLRRDRGRGGAPRATSAARRAARPRRGSPTSAPAARGSGASAAISGPAKTPSRASSSRRRTAAASSVESGIRPPIQRGTAPLLPLARRTQAVMSRTRPAPASRPAKMKRSPGRSRAMNDSSTVPSRPPLTYWTVSAASLVMVPIDIRCRRATARSGTV